MPWQAHSTGDACNVLGVKVSDLDTSAKVLVAAITSGELHSSNRD